MTTKRTYFGPTTPQQRRLLFQIWQETGNVTHACAVARVGRRTFYYWKPRFDQLGFSGLESFASTAPHQPHQTEQAIAEQVVALRQANPSWGKRRIAHELAKANHWNTVLSPNTVRRILEDASLWQAVAAPKKKGFHTWVRTAEQVAQTLNIDLCFVPAVHTYAAKLPAISGSSGRLVVERQSQPKAERVYPGQLFADPQLSYTEAMQQFAQASHKRFEQRKYPLAQEQAVVDPRLGLRAEAAALRDQRRVVRVQRQTQDQAWRELWKKRQAVLEARRANAGAIAWTDDGEDVEWSVLRQQRHTTLLERQAEDAVWRSQHNELRQALANKVLPTSWRAILLITDNCTRQCYELPLFASGGRVSAEEVMSAFERVVPNGVEFVISDQGTHFMAKVFEQLAERSGFVHVPIARHRPQSNGIAERCVRTLKQWLGDKEWSSDEELSVLLEAYRLHYNERPHQGLGIPGLSPNEFARRIWLL